MVCNSWVLIRQLCNLHDIFNYCHIQLRIWPLNLNLLTIALLVFISWYCILKQESDCCRGLVIDGLASVFTCSITATLQTALKALKTCKHIYVVNLHDTYDAIKAHETAQRQAKGKNHPTHRRMFFSCFVECNGVLSIVKVALQWTVYCLFVSQRP